MVLNLVVEGKSVLETVLQTVAAHGGRNKATYSVGGIGATRLAADAAKLSAQWQSPRRRGRNPPFPEFRTRSTNRSQVAAR